MINLKEFVDYLSKRLYGISFKPYDVEIRNLGYECAGEFIIYLEPYEYPVGKEGECKMLLDKFRVDLAERDEDALYRLVGTICHEVTHFALWYQGLDCEDEDNMFLNKAKEIGFCDNYDLYDLDEKKMKEYYDDFVKEHENHTFISKEAII